MWSESCNYNFNSSQSNSDSSSNSADATKNLETMECRFENRNTIIKRVWITKKSINLHDEHVKFSDRIIKLGNDFINKLTLDIFMQFYASIFNIESCFTFSLKHWAIILELSNNSYVNIQFGRTGFSLKEFNRTEIEGENLLNAIINTWGEKNDPFSFCYLGYANYEYEKLKNYLRRKKEKEFERFKESRCTYYNVCFKNCQHFCCDIEKYLFGGIKFWHFFDYYIHEFFEKFFPRIDITKLKLKHEEEIKKKNEAIIKEYENEIKNNKNKFGQGKIKYLIYNQFGSTFMMI